MISEKVQKLIDDVIISARRVEALSLNGNEKQFSKAWDSFEKRQKSLTAYIEKLEKK